MNEINEMQCKIIDLYKETFANYKRNLNLSVPFMPRIPEEFLENRTVIIGQETNTWYRDNTNDGLSNVFLKNLNNIAFVCLESRYDKFMKNHISNYKGKFWEFNKMLYDKKIIKGNFINNKMNISHVWLNLFLVEACARKDDKKGRPTQNKILRREIIEIQKNLLFNILAILKPKLIISLTGYSMDGVLLSNALCTKNYQINDVDKNKILKPEMLGVIEIEDKDHPLKNTKIIRCYHPSYFLSRINTFKKLKAELKEKGCQMTNSKYYSKQLFEYLLDTVDDKEKC